jgi:hypothetical protein
VHFRDSDLAHSAPGHRCNQQLPAASSSAPKAPAGLAQPDILDVAAADDVPATMTDPSHIKNFLLVRSIRRQLEIFDARPCALVFPELLKADSAGLRESRAAVAR